MLVFIDESGDMGYQFARGSSLLFTIAAVVFDSGDNALACQKAIEQARSDLGFDRKFEFHFSGDSRRVRLAFLEAIRGQRFRIFTFTMNKQRVMGEGLKRKSPGYKWVCRVALDNMREELVDAAVVIDGSGEREFRLQLQSYLKRAFNKRGEVPRVTSVKLSRSESDPLVQLADYVASITNRVQNQKKDATELDAYLRQKRVSTRLWP